MTDETQMPDPQDGGMPVQPPVTPEPAPASAMGGFTANEGMVAIGGLVVLVVWLIFEVITDDYVMATLAVVLAAVAAILPRLNREAVERVAPLPVLLKVTGYLLALTGLTEVIYNIEAAFFDNFLTVIAALGAYAGYALAFLGARSIKT